MTYCAFPTQPNEDPAMKGMHPGDIVMDQDGRIAGMVAGDVVIRPGCDVRISGMVAGDVYVEEGPAPGSVAWYPAVSSTTVARCASAA